MDNKNTNPPSGEDTSWLDELLASSDYGEDVIQNLANSVEDLELDRIIRESKADEWDLGDSVLPEVEEPVYQEEPEAEVAPELSLDDIIIEWDDDEIEQVAEETEEAPIAEDEAEIPEDSERKVRPKRNTDQCNDGNPDTHG